MKLFQKHAGQPTDSEIDIGLERKAPLKSVAAWSSWR